MEGWAVMKSAGLTARRSSGALLRTRNRASGQPRAGRVFALVRWCSHRRMTAKPSKTRVSNLLEAFEGELKRDVRIPQQDAISRLLVPHPSAQSRQTQTDPAAYRGERTLMDDRDSTLSCSSWSTDR